MKENLLGSRPFVHKFCDICYVDKSGRGKFFPYFCPMSTCAVCCILGHIQTALLKEEKLMCDMGRRGIFCCMLSAPIIMFGPFGGCVYLSCLSIMWRDDVKRDYNVTEEDPGYFSLTRIILIHT
jgi:hypothetical protein